MPTPRLSTVLRRELAPFDGRLNTAWRVAATCSLTVMLFMVYGIPLVAIGCYLVLFVMKPNQAETLLMAIGICLLVGIMMPVLLGITRLAIEYPVWRLAILIACSVFFMFLQAGSQLGPAGGIIALVIVFILTMLGEVPTGEIATRAILYAGLMAVVPMATLLGFNALFGPSVSHRMASALAKRLGAVQQLLRHPSSGTRQAVLDLLHEGDEGLEKMLLFIRLFHLQPRARQQALGQAMEATRMLLLASAALPCTLIHQQAGPCQALADRCEALSKAVRRGQCPDASSPAAQNVDWDNPLEALAAMLQQFPRPAPATRIDSPLAQKGFFAVDAWRNPQYQQYALKTTLAAVLCYWIYTAIQWQDIHTALITCYVGALGTTAETLHKLTLRITGCLIGAAIGVLSIYFLIPSMTSIGALMALVFAVTLLAAWVSTGSELSAYAGVQIGLAFLLTVLTGFGPSVDMSAALYRVMGILLGNVVLYLVFTRIWPVSAASAARHHLRLIWHTLRLRQTQSDPPLPATLRADAPNALRHLAQARHQLDLIPFEPAHVRPDARSIHQLHQVTEQLERFYLRHAYPGVPHGAADEQADDLARALNKALESP